MSPGWTLGLLVEPMGFESTSDMETKEFCGAAWPSKVLKRKERNSYCPLIAPRNLPSEVGTIACGQKSLSHRFSRA